MDRDTTGTTSTSRRVRLPRSVVFLILAALLVVAVFRSIPSSTGDRPVRLRPGQAVPATATLHHPRSFLVTAHRGDFVHVVVEQPRFNVKVALFEPDGRFHFETDFWKRSAEEIFFVAHQSGTYRVQVGYDREVLEHDELASDPATEARFVVRLEARRPATPRDRAHVDAFGFLRLGLALASDFDRDSLRRPDGVRGLRALNEAGKCWHDLGNRKWESRLLLDLGMRHHAAGEFRAACSCFEKMRRLGRAEGFPELEAGALTQLGMVCQFRDNERALACFQAALPLMKTLRRRDMIGTLHNQIGTTSLLLNQPDEALMHLEAMLEIWGEGGSHEIKVHTHRVLAGTYMLVGQRDKARRHNDWLKEHAPAAPSPSRLETTRGREQTFEKRLQDLWLVLARFSNVPADVAVPELRETAQSLTRDLASFQKDFAGSFTLSLYNLGLGMIWTRVGDQDKALQYTRQALAIGRRFEVESYRDSIQTFLGEIQMKRGRHAEARVLLEQALDRTRRRGEVVGLPYILGQLARLHRARGDLESAWQCAREGLDLLDRRHRSFLLRQAQLAFLDRTHVFHEQAVSILMELDSRRPGRGFAREALQVQERSRDRLFREELRRAGGLLDMDVNPELAAQKVALEQELEHFEGRLARHVASIRTGTDLESIRKSIQDLSEQLEKIQARIRRQNPRYAALTRPPSLSIADLQRRVVDHETVLLEYALGAEQSHLWVITPDRITSHALPGRTELESTARRLVAQITARNQRLPGEDHGRQLARIARADAEVERLAAHLGQRLVAPAADRLAGKRLVVVADGALQQIPFGLLPDPAAPDQPLLENHDIVYLPSAATLALLRKEWRPRGRASRYLAILADPVFTRQDSRFDTKPGPGVDETAVRPSPTAALRGVVRTWGFDEDRGIDRLVFSGRAARAIEERVRAHGRSVFVARGFEATRALVRSDRLLDYRVLHFSTHGFADPTRPDLSGLVLSLLDRSGRPRPGFLRLHEIYGLKLRADLVVLSCCRTAVGRDYRGEGLASLARGFMYAGAPRVVATLWNVDDEATGRLMARFHENLLEQPTWSPARALREAQRAVRRETASSAPYFWAGVVFLGDWKSPDRPAPGSRPESTKDPEQ